MTAAPGLIYLPNAYCSFLCLAFANRQGRHFALLRGNYRVDETNSAIDCNASCDRDVPPCIAVMVPESAVFTNTRPSARISGACRGR